MNVIVGHKICVVIFCLCDKLWRLFSGGAGQAVENAWIMRSSGSSRWERMKIKWSSGSRRWEDKKIGGTKIKILWSIGLWFFGIVLTSLSWQCHCEDIYEGFGEFGLCLVYISSDVLFFIEIQILWCSLFIDNLISMSWRFNCDDICEGFGEFDLCLVYISIDVWFLQNWLEMVIVVLKLLYIGAILSWISLEFMIKYVLESFFEYDGVGGNIFWRMSVWVGICCLWFCITI